MNNQREMATDFARIPGEYGLPLLGQAIPVATDIDRFLKKQLREYGPVSRTNIGLGMKGLAIIDPQVAGEIFLDKNREFSSQMGYKRIEPFFNGGLGLIDFDEHRIQRRIMQTAFKSQAMKGYTETINSIYDKHLALWTQQDDLNFFEAIKTCLMDVAMQVFIGRNEKPETLALLTREFEYLVNGMSHIVPWAAPGTAKRRAIKARQWIENYLHEVLPEKRRIVSNDMFSYFCHEEKGSGELYSDEEVVAHIIFLLFATHDTTACALTNSLYELVQQPRYLQQLREEVQALGPDVPAYNALDQMKLAQAVFNETLRLHPGAPMSARETTRPTTIGEFQVPANVPLFVFNFGIHRHPDYWERPDEFDPQRWLTTETAARHPFAFVPFGGGAHKCVGMHFSMMEYKLLLFKLMTGFEVTLATPQVSAINLLPMPHPKDGLRLRIRAR